MQCASENERSVMLHGGEHVMSRQYNTRDLERPVLHNDSRSTQRQPRATPPPFLFYASGIDPAP